MSAQYRQQTNTCPKGTNKYLILFGFIMAHYFYSTLVLTNHNTVYTDGQLVFIHSITLLHANYICIKKQHPHSIVDHYTD